MSEVAGATGGRAVGRVGNVINGKWRIDARLGSGGMATVYAATHRNGTRAALKMLHTQLSRDEGTRARFLREGYVANAVGHPGVVQVLDDDVAEDGAAILVLELLEGETIEARRMRFGGSLPVDEVLDLADQALDALGAAHEKGIVHRDVKPDNVFVTHEGTVKLLDFGLAHMKDAQAEATKTGVTIGTPEFMPPEQALGRRNEIDARSDVWGLGATLFTAITGEYVHHASTLHEQLVASATQRARPIRQLAPHVDREVAAVIDRALELEMDDRWPSAREMQDALRDARGGAQQTIFDANMTVPLAPSSDMGDPTSSEKTQPMVKTGERPALPRIFGDEDTVLHYPRTGVPATPQAITARLAPQAEPVILAYTPGSGVAAVSSPQPASVSPTQPQPLPPPSAVPAPPPHLPVLHPVAPPPPERVSRAHVVIAVVVVAGAAFLFFLLMLSRVNRH